MAGNRFFIIGISGVTNSGKSSLASRLSKTLPNCTWMCQDHYFLSADDPRVEMADNGMRNWDVLSSIDMDTMLDDVHSWIESQRSASDPPTSFLVIEGFTVFNYGPISKLFDQKMFIQLDPETSYERRQKRVYDPPDLPGYFKEVAWPMYLKNLKEIEDQRDIIYIDGCIDLDSLYEEIFNHIKTTFPDNV